MKASAYPPLVVDGMTIPVMAVHTVIVGSGAAGLNAAVQLKRQGVDTTTGKNGAGAAGIDVAGRMVRLIGLALSASAAMVAW